MTAYILKDRHFSCMCVCVSLCWYFCVVEFSGGGESGGGSAETSKLTLSTKLGLISDFAPVLHVILSLCESSREKLA